VNSCASSPLSEREVSPPPGFELPTTAPGLLPAVSRERPTYYGEQCSSGNPNAELPPSTAFIRRNLRTRKAIQLAPYQFDKAQYHQQWKARGLRPIRLMEQESAQEEADSQFQTGSSQIAYPSSAASSSVGSKLLRPQEASHEGLDYFDMGNSSDEVAQTHRLPKRKKLGNVSSKDRNSVNDSRPPPQPRNAWSQIDEFSIPPSPPRTSSDLSNVDDSETLFRQTATGFRIPLGLTPVPLPTPQVSSDVKRNIDDASASDSPPRRSRMSAGRRPVRTQSAISIPSSSESESDQQSELEVRRLQHERKRIRGVLPASWLKIDLQAQQAKSAPAVSRGRRLSTASPAKAEAQKGVARKIGRATQRSQSPILPELPGDTSDSDDSAMSPKVSRAQPRLELRPDRLSIAPDLTVDDDLMENDFIDPMLAGRVRQSKPKSLGIHQPRITESFRSTSNFNHDFTEERCATISSSTVGRQKRVSKTKGARRQRRRPAVHLSIADVTTSQRAEMKQLPQFIKLAVRQTRHESDRGRHSPTNKLIRLATAHDTEEASSVLRAWREGTIAPRSDDHGWISEDDIHLPLNNDTGHSPDNEPLREQVQQAFSASTVRKRPYLNQHSSKRRRMQQTRLHPTVLSAGSHEPMTHETRKTPSAPIVARASRQVPRPQRLREAQLETLERDFDASHREAVFERRMQCMTESIARSSRRSGTAGFQLDRFLRADSTALPEIQPTRQRQAGDRQETDGESRPTVTLAHRPRKATARRLDVEAREYRQPSEPLPQDIDEPEVIEASAAVDVSIPVLHGLRPFGTRYSIDFDMQPLDHGIFFHHSTFIGSGDFHDALNIPDRDLDRGLGHVRVQIEEQAFEWDAWNEDVAAQVNRIPGLISNALQTLDSPEEDIDPTVRLSTVEGNINYLLRSVIRYLSKCVWFIDPVDRKSCVETLNALVTTLLEIGTESWTSKRSLLGVVIRVLQYQVVIAKQAVVLCDHSAVPFGLKSSTEKLLLRASRSLAKRGIGRRFAELRSFYEDNRRAADRESGILDETVPWVSLVILRNTLVDSRAKSTLFWHAISEALQGNLTDVCDVRTFEVLSQNILTILPALEVDSTGIVKTGSRFTTQLDDWSLVKAIVSRVLGIYDSSSQIRGYSVNEYVRALLARCHCLVNKWGWWRCESLLNTAFDFFARRSFNLLQKEEVRGSPKFLEELHSSDVPLDVAPEDCSFHIFLKMLSTGLRGMQKYNVYADRKILSIIWRFIPNHNRMYRKDTDLHKKDLDALRNQHDLFSVLYYASPTKGRIGVDLVLGLVDHATSHREACRLSVRAWSNIACYQASSLEPVEALEELTRWFSSTIKTTFAQYRLAKVEAEQDFQRARQEIEGSTEASVDHTMLETTIASNQRQIAAIIIDALAGLKRAIRCASDLTKARALVDQTHFVLIFDLFDPSQRRLLSAMQETLLVCDAALDMQQRFEPAPGSAQTTNDDSQDFGDISAIEAFAADENSPTSPVRGMIADALLTPLGQFLSNVFGADVAPEDSLLQQVIDVWTRLANVTVCSSSAKRWSTYVDDYGATAWNQLRDTTQKRKFTPYFMSQILVHSNGHEDVKEAAFVAWLLSLVDREATLKFQHCLTSALLNFCGDDPLLSNLPFTRERSSDRYDITLTDLRQRRLGLLSSVLHNMRTHHDEVSCESTSRGHELRSRYAGMLRQLMQAMKANYQDLQNGRNDSVANASLQGGYVDFVQNVVSFLQQYALGICQVDRFFTDSSAFPLPATDPTYVVGRLRSYIPKLAEASGRTQLAMFIQTVSERAATDNQQPYLVNQMAAAMGDVEELGDEDRPTLRSVLLTSIFPAYVAKAISSSCFWIPATPILEACGRVIGNIFYNFQIEDDKAVLAVVESIASILHSICLQCDHVLLKADLLRLPRVLRMLGVMVGVGNSCLTITSYIQRATSLGGELSRRVQALQQQAVTIAAHLQHRSDGAFYQNPEIGSAPLCPWPDTQAVAEKQVRESVNTKWHAIDERYFVQRGSSMKEVVVELGDSKDEEAALLQVIASFCRAFEATI
ncbi:hypothetical protein M409DRAFT_33996, partial [Zasmidium cellare ATCC 36951]